MRAVLITLVAAGLCLVASASASASTSASMAEAAADQSSSNNIPYVDAGHRHRRKGRMLAAASPREARALAQSNNHLHISVDNHFMLYVDGQYIGHDVDTENKRNWLHTYTFAVPKEYDVVSIYANNTGRTAGILVSVTDGLISSTAWRCTETQPAAGWTEEGFDDDEWPHAFAYGRNSWYGSYGGPHRVGIDSQAQWIWGKMNNMSVPKVWCRGRRWAVAENYTYSDGDDGDEQFLFKYVPQNMGWEAAEKNCRKYGVGSHLASIHSDEENEFVREMAHGVASSTKTPAPQWWIGLNDKAVKDEWVWSDGSELDFYMWGDNEPNDVNHKENCVEQYSHNGQWNDDDCTAHPHPSVCKFPDTFTNPDDHDDEECVSEKEDADERAEKCFMYFSEETPGECFNAWGKSFKEDPPDNMCVPYANLPQCCSSDYVTNTIHKEWQSAIQEMAADSPCREALKKMMCVMCDRDQVDFMTISKTGGFAVRICQESCETLMQDCVAETGWKGLTPQQACEKTANLDHVAKFTAMFEVVDSTSSNCFRFDDRPPMIAKVGDSKVDSFFPANGATSVDASVELLTLQFNEQVVTSETANISIAKTKTGDVVYSARVSNELAVSLDSTFKKMTVRFVDEKGMSKCVFQGNTQYSVRLPANMAHDVKGNGFAGNGNGHTDDNPWTFTTSDTTCHDGLGGGSIAAIVILTLLLIGGVAGFWVYKKKVLDPRRYMDVANAEGQIVETEEGAHQVRFVPVFSPPNSSSGDQFSDGSAGSSVNAAEVNAFKEETF